MEIDGFSDGRGTIEGDLASSKQRAEVVKSALVSRGIPAATISAYGYGRQAPVASDADAVGRQRNRRVEVVIGNEGGAIPGWSDM